MLVYYPVLIDSELAHEGTVSGYSYQLHSNCRVQGNIDYKYLFFVFDDDPDVPIFVVSAEKAVFPEGELFFCMFSSRGHHNMGIHSDIVELQAFFQKALRLASMYL